VTFRKWFDAFGGVLFWVLWLKFLSETPAN